MKVTVTQQNLNHALGTVRHAVNNSSTLPILANILLSTDQGRLKLSATNLEIGINCWIDCEVQEQGSTTVPAKTMLDLVGSLRSEQLVLSVDESHTMNIKGKGSNATIKGMDPSEFPLIPGRDGSEFCAHFESDYLKESLPSVAMAAADDDARPVLTGVHFEVKDGALTLAAADAFRLAVLTCAPASVVLNDKHLVSEPLLIPARTLEHLAKILPSEEKVQMLTTPNRSQVLFHTENVDLVSRLIEGTFPNFRGIMPKNHTTRAVVETKEFSAAVKTIMPFARDSSNIARIKFEQSDEDKGFIGALTIEATAEDIGSNVSTISAHVDGPSQEITFNAKYLADVLGALDSTEVSLEIEHANRPGVVKPINGGDYTYIIMPMSTNR